MSATDDISSAIVKSSVVDGGATPVVFVISLLLIAPETEEFRSQVLPGSRAANHGGRNEIA